MGLEAVFITVRRKSFNGLLIYVHIGVTDAEFSFFSRLVFHAESDGEWEGNIYGYWLMIIDYCICHTSIHPLIHTYNFFQSYKRPPTHHPSIHPPVHPYVRPYVHSYTCKHINNIEKLLLNTKITHLLIINILSA